MFVHLELNKLSVTACSFASNLNNPRDFALQKSLKNTDLTRCV